jgi:ATP-dependent DNA helicase DinG
MADQFPALARVKALHAGLDGVWLADGDSVQPITRGAALRLAADEPVILLNAPLTGARIGTADLTGLDLLELFALVRPARFCVPTPAGLARVLRLEVPDHPGGEALLLRAAAEALIAELVDPRWPARTGARAALAVLQRHRWAWSSLIPPLPEGERRGGERSLFTALPEWEDSSPRARPFEVSLAEPAVQARLAQLTARGAEDRPAQRAYAAAATHAFQPRQMEAAPNVALAEAGTGTGKTLGYLAPASLWAEQARGTVWISTHTKALQRQLDQELDKLYPDPAAKARAAVVRKGRENYLCLLNLEEMLNGAAQGRMAVLAQLVERWARFTRDGDMIGGDFPAWLLGLFGSGRLASLTDRRGECVYSACPHYRRCFIEKSARAAAQADLVIANHALVMVNAVRGRAEGQGLTRLVFDEGHHLFEASDSTFSTHLTGAEALELRRWLLGLEGRGRGRRRGLEARLSEIVLHDEAVATHLSAVLAAARALPAPDWLGRVAEGAPFGPFEALFAGVRAHVYARAQPEDAGYGLEAELVEPLPALVEAAQACLAGVDALGGPMAALEARLSDLLEDRPDWLDGSLKPRIEGALSGIALRRQTLGGWASLLARVGGHPEPDLVDWAALDRIDGRELDAGLHRHWVDPTRAFAKLVLEPAHGVLMTSATLRDRTIAESDAGWARADLRTGVQHLALPPVRFSTPSPFDYARAAQVLIVTDIKRGDIGQLAAAYRDLIRAAGGGALGLFTAIARLKAVNARLRPALAEAGLPLYAQHVDPLDTGTLVDLFRAERAASLLGTDALRDGVDVPGDSLRLVVLEGVPWPRPTILHAHRRAAFGGPAYDDQVTRARLAQAFGRLIRRQSDRGVFVLLGAAVPSRLLSAFPHEAPVARVSLAEAVARVAQTVGPLPGAGRFPMTNATVPFVQDQP